MGTIPKKWIYLITILTVVIIVLVIGYYFLVYNASCEQTISDNGPGRGRGGYWAQNYTLIAILTIVIVTVILISYYLMSKKVNKNLEENMRIISEIVNPKNNNNQSENKELKNQYKTVLLKFLNYNENKVVKKIIENNGSILQSEISRMPGMGKVKTHRILKDMKIKNIISIEKYGKTNRINLSEDIKKIFLE